VVGSLAVAIISGGGCGKGLFPEVTSSATTTSTPVTNAFLYATNFNDGTVSAFGRNTNTGALSFISKRNAGAVSGPNGIAVTKQNDLVYVANAADGNVYGFSIVQSGSGTPGDLASVGAGVPSGGTPQIVAIDQTGSFVYVTNAGTKTVSEFVINNDGTLSSNGSVVAGFPGKPFGITAHPSANFIYVADNTGGRLYTYSIGTNGVLTLVGTSIPSNGGSQGNPGLMAIAVDSSQAYLLVDDTALGVVSVFLIQNNGSLVYGGTFGTSSASKPIGIGAVNNTNNYVLTANMNGNFVQPYLRTQATLTQQTSFAVNTNPTGLVVDPGNLFAYTGNSGNGTIAVIGINNSLCGTKPFCVVKSFPSESPTNLNAGTQFLATTH
jgi:DNA-binding beta-propeller fold protein YncE